MMQLATTRLTFTKQHAGRSAYAWSVFLFFFSFSLVFFIGACDGSTNERSIGIANVSGSSVEVYWSNPDTKELHLMVNLEQSATFEIGSYAGHTFTVKELPSESTGRCINGRDRACGTAFFHVTSMEVQVFHIGKDLKIEIKDNDTIDIPTPSDSIPTGELSDCQSLALSPPSPNTPPNETISTLTTCVSAAIAARLILADEAVKFQSTLRNAISERLENYTCADHSLPSTQPLRTERWVHGNATHPVTRHVDILHDRPASRVHVVRDFISRAECGKMERTARKKLHKATVADGKGGSELSPNRKAMQAGITIPWGKERDGNLLTRISRRVYDYTERVLGLGIDERGQEDLMSIQYEGRGADEKEPDRYMPHCDGDCTGVRHRAGQRMATVVMYCTVPEVGGATNFRNAGLHVVPEEGSATFFSYMDPDTFVMDDAFTTHSGCPVIVGEKKIVTQWIRYGVDDENPWDSFNTLGIKLKDLADQE